MSFGRNNSLRNSEAFNLNSNTSKGNTKCNKLENLLEDILNKNNLSLSQIESLIKYKSYASKDIEHYEKVVKEIEQDLKCADDLLPPKSDSLHERYQKIISKEKVNYNLVKEKFNELKSISHGSTGGSEFSNNPTENKGLLQEYDQYKVNKNDIKFMKDISKYREEKLTHINEQIHLIDKYSKDMAFMTNQSGKQLNNLVDNIDVAYQHQNDANTLLIKTNKEEQAFKENKCCVILLLTASLLFLLVLFCSSR